ncbi:MFS transporter [Pseudonocardiaceae bacterium YIM PH 21723]|nr:MFS transporter [Pseudonocardiaceae bacterium YIM PH 21723]
MRNSSGLARVVSAGVIGTTVEFYDFFLYGAAAATVFPKVFFPHAQGLLGVLAALGTYAVGFVARPLGGIVFGHFGDKFGRKRLLVISLMLMGLSSVGIGLLPGYAQIGALAPTLLIVLRLIQGFALGGEFGGAVLLAAEHAPAESRGFWTAWPQTGGGLGNLLATAATALAAYQLGPAAYGEWGWRLPFLASILLVVVGLWVRLRVAESPLFVRTQQKHGTERAPILTVLREHPRPLLAVFFARIGENASFYMFTIFLLVYADHIGLPRPLTATAVTIGSLFQVAATVGGGALSDRLGRRPVAVAAALVALVWGFVFFPLVDSRQLVLVTLGVTVGLMAQGLLVGAQVAYFAEIFGTDVRYSGVSLGYQGATVVAGAGMPLGGTWLLEHTGGTLAVSGLLALTLIVTIVGMSVARIPQSTGLNG